MTQLQMFQVCLNCKAYHPSKTLKCDCCGYEENGDLVYRDDAAPALQKKELDSPNLHKLPM